MSLIDNINLSYPPEAKDQLNRLARLLYAIQGYEVREGFDFSTSQHPTEKAMFAQACAAMNFFLDEGL